MTKTIDDIYGEMLEVFAQESGYLPASSCDLAVRLYAAAAQIQSLLIQAQWVLDQSFPQTAQGGIPGPAGSPAGHQPQYCHLRHRKLTLWCIQRYRRRFVYRRRHHLHDTGRYPFRHH